MRWKRAAPSNIRGWKSHDLRLIPIPVGLSNPYFVPRPLTRKHAIHGLAPLGVPSSRQRMSRAMAGSVDPAVAASVTRATV